MNETTQQGRRIGVGSAIGRALGYLILFLGWQSVVSTAYTYSAYYEQSLGGALPPEYLLGQRAAVLGGGGVGMLILLITAAVLRIRGGSLRRLMGMQETAAPGVTALAAAGLGVCVVGVMAMLGNLAWKTLVGMLHFVSITMEGQMPDIQALYDAMVSKTGEISAVSGILTLVTLALLFRLRKKRIRDEVLLYPVSGRTLGWSVGLAFCLYWVVTVALSCLPEPWLEGYMAASEGLGSGGILLFIATAFLAPVVEEITFRSLVFTRLRRGMSPVLAMLLSAFVFGYCHGETIWFCYAFVLGLVFVLVTRHTNSVLPALVMHVVFNLTNEILAYWFGAWEPDTAVWIVIAVVGVGGTALCALRLRREIRRTGPHCPAADIPPLPVEPLVEEAPAVPVEAEPVLRGTAPARPAAAAWDADSGPNHKFPPHLR